MLKTMSQVPPAPQPNVYREGAFIVIDELYRYAIPIDRCNTHAKLLGWVFHLSAKRWVTKPVLIAFIATACEVSGIAIERGM